MTKLGKGLEAANRRATGHEANLIRWLLAHGDKDAERFLSQIENLTVISQCNCGCPTIYFDLGSEATSRKGEQLISDYLATVEGKDVGVMLFEVGGRLSSLEVYSCAGTDQPFGLPEIESLFPWEKLSEHRQNPQ
jgi:hypothetical protein